MNEKPIGGYFGWEFSFGDNGFPHNRGNLLNSGHHALQYLLHQIGSVKKVYIAYYTCNSLEWPLKALNLKYEFYHINNSLELAGELNLNADEYLIYTNYFGIKDAYVQTLQKKYGCQLIIDNAQAFYAKDIVGCYQIYSPRKYVGCPDGGIVYPAIGTDYKHLSQSHSYDRCAALLQRADGEVGLGYQSFHDSEGLLKSADVMKMSVLTNNILSNTNHAAVIERRRTNFTYLHAHLASKNTLSHLLNAKQQDSFNCPMVYPFYTNDEDLRQRLIDNKVFVAKYWPNVLEWCRDTDVEYMLASHILPLPIDQRYGVEDMNRIIELICK